jgi:hypothetical protein
VDLVELNQYVNSLLKTSFSCEHQHLVTTASHIFGIGGFFDNAPIIEETMKSFLEENKHDFDMLADEHIKHMIFLK